MTRAALSHAYRLYSFSETIIAAFAQANVPYAAQILLFLQIAELSIARAMAHIATAQPNPNQC